jgi:hypothetical protein
MQRADAIAVIFSMVALATMVIGVAHYWYKARVAKLQQAPDVEKRLARLEVAIDDMSAELSRVVEGQQFANKLLADRSPEASRVGP